MRKASLLLILLLTVTLFAPATYAIREVTPTPQPTPQPTTPPPTPETPAQPDAPDAPETDSAVQELLGQAGDRITSGDPQGAIELTNEVLALNPLADEAYALRGIANAQLGRLQRAIDDYTQALEIKNYEWTYYTFRANTYSQLGEFGSAFQDYNEAIRYNPRFSPAFRNRADLNNSLGESIEANIDELIADGLNRLNFGDNAGAISNFTEAIDAESAQNATMAAAYYNRGLANYNLGDLTAAIEDYSSAIDALPTMHDPYLARGIAYAEQDRIQAAGEDFIERIDILESKTYADSISIGSQQDVDMAFGSVYRLTFEGSAGQSVTLAARDVDGVGVDPLIALLGPDGAAIAGDDDLGGFFDSQIEAFELPADGTYTLVVSHANGGFDGTVRVTLE